MTQPELTGKNVLIIVGPDFEDREVFYPQLRMMEAGAKVTIAGIGEDQYKGKYGVPIDVDGPCQQYVNKTWDAVIIPGGWAPDKIRMNTAALSIVQKTVEANRVVAAICHGGWVLCSANVIRNRQVTSYVAIKDDMINAGGQWKDEACVVDGPIVTSRTPWDLPDFCKAIIGLVSKAPALV